MIIALACVANTTENATNILRLLSFLYYQVHDDDHMETFLIK